MGGDGHRRSSLGARKPRIFRADPEKEKKRHIKSPEKAEELWQPPDVVPTSSYISKSEVRRHSTTNSAASSQTVVDTEVQENYGFFASPRNSQHGARTENVDGADFRKHFARMNIDATETVEPQQVQYANTRNETSRVPLGKYENSAFSPAHCENSWMNLQDEKRVEVNEVRGRRRQENEILREVSTSISVETSLKGDGVGLAENFAKSLNLKKEDWQVLEDVPANPAIQQSNLDVSEYPPRLSKLDPSLGSSPRSDDIYLGIDPSQIGFVEYLHVKGLEEVRKGNEDTAKAYVDRLKSIQGTEKVIKLLEDEKYSQIVRLGVKMLEKDDTAAAYQLLDSLQEPSLRSYREYMQASIEDHFLNKAAQQASSTQQADGIDYQEALDTIAEIEKLREGWGYPKETRDTEKLKFLLGVRMRDVGLSHIRQKADVIVGLRCIQALSCSGIREREKHIRTVSVAIAEYFWNSVSFEGQLGPPYTEEDQNDHNTLWGWWPTLTKVDRALNISRLLKVPHVTDIHGSGHLQEYLFEEFRNDEVGRQAIIDQTYDYDDILSEILDKRNTLLGQIRQLAEKKVYQDLGQLNWASAYTHVQLFACFWSTNPFKDAPKSTSSESIERTDSSLSGTRKLVKRPNKPVNMVKILLSSSQLVVMFYIISRYKLNRLSLPTPVLDIKEIELLPEMAFVYYLTLAEVAYFSERNLDNALMWALKAAAIDTSLPWATKSDVLYLLARIYHRKGLPLDADYHYSLIPTAEEYDEWRIYGYPGRVLSKDLNSAGVSPTLSRGKLIINAEALKNLVNLLFTLSAEQTDYSRNIDRSAVVSALYADDLSWATTVVTAEIRNGYKRGRHTKTMLGFLTLAGPIDYLQIALQNPWADIDMVKPKMQFASEALFRAASIYDPDKVRLAIKHGASPEAIVKGSTALHYMLNFYKGVRLDNAKIRETLEIFTAFYGSNPRTPLNWERKNDFGSSPISLMADSLERELQGTVKERGYLKRFQTTWEVIKDFPHDLDVQDPAFRIFEQPAIIEQRFSGLFSPTLEILNFRMPRYRLEEIGGTGSVSGQGASSSTSSPKKPLTTPARKEVKEVKEEKKRVKRFGIF